MLVATIKVTVVMMEMVPMVVVVMFSRGVAMQLQVVICALIHLECYLCCIQVVCRPSTTTIITTTMAMIVRW